MLVESIKSVYDQFPDSNYVLTGSSQLLLSNKVKESLAGRCAIFEIFPLTIPEVITKNWEEEIRLSVLQKLLLTGELPDLLPSFMMDPEYARREGAFYHLRTVDGREVDLLIETEKGYYAMEIKMTAHVSDSDARHLRDLGSYLNKPLLSSYVLSNDPSVHRISENILAIPVAMFLS